MVEMGLQNDVTLITTSDFGRRLHTNGNGTDHGWGGHQFVVGGAVKGNQLYGAIPEPTLSDEHIESHGMLIPQISVEQYVATIGAWFGFSESELLTMLPNLANFTSKNIGFI
jgi:uncharacterized protein (DUF1501 family)